MKSGKELFEYLRKKGGGYLVLLLSLCALFILLSGASAKEEDRTAAEDNGLEALCSSVEGVGKCKVSVIYGEEGEVCAAAVLCEGGESVEVREKLCRLIASLYGIGYNRISVLKISE